MSRSHPPAQRVTKNMTTSNSRTSRCRRRDALFALALTCPAFLGAASAQEASPQQRTRRTVAEVRAAAREIDALVEAALDRAGATPNRLTDDATFVRRAYLSIVGRIPTATETRTFLDSDARDRRGELVDRLIASPGHDSHMFHWWADLLRAKSRLARQTSGEPYLHWIKQALADDRPYDRVVTELLTASGPAHARGNGATGYFLRDRGMPEDSMSNTVRVFLGTRLECAQCHNHPYDKWTQKQFFEMVAFTGGMAYSDEASRNSEAARELATLYRKVRSEQGGQAAQVLRRLLQTAHTGISGSGTGLARLPHDYKYEDARPDQVVAANTMFGADVDLPVNVPSAQRSRARARRPQPQRDTRPRDGFPAVDSRATYAAWLTSPDNPRFTTVISNRMWKRVMGLGLIEPVDDFTDQTTASNPELMARLDALMIELGYDLEEFQRVLFHTRTWQRETARAEPDPDEPYLFPGPVLRRLSAEQLWDSLLALSMSDVDKTIRAAGVGAEPVYARYEQILASDADEIAAEVEQQTLRFSDPAKFREMQRRRAAERAAAEMTLIGEQQERQRADGDRVRELLREIARARRERDRKAVAALEAELTELRSTMDEQRRRFRDRGRAGSVRASELPSPAPPDHFLRQFGQSDREQIDAADSSASVPQALALINGIVETRILAPGSELARLLAAAKTPKDQIHAVFLTLLSRAPTSDESQAWIADWKVDAPRAREDLVWTLVNSNEFRFLR